MPNEGIAYFSHGTKHAARLAVSLYSLRRHYRGPVAIFDTADSPEAAAIVERIAGDDRLAAAVIRVPLARVRRNACYCTKAGLWRHSPFAVTILMDADTIIAGDPSPLLGMADNPAGPGFVVTRFSNWITTGEIVGNRIRRWIGVPSPPDAGIDLVELIDASLRKPHPAINTGITAWRRGAEFLEPWKALTLAGWRTPFTDELACQLLLREFEHVLVDDRWNCSPIYGVSKSRAVIYHCHGGKHLRPEALPVWWPLFEQCRALNIAGINDWLPAGDERLAEYLASRADECTEATNARATA